jgi:hypothetical protein
MKKAEELLAKLLETLKKDDSKENTIKVYKGYINTSSIDKDTKPNASFDTVEEAAEWAMEQGDSLITIINQDFEKVYSDFPNIKTKKTVIRISTDNDTTALKIAKIGQIAMNEFTNLLAKDDNILATSGETKIDRKSDKPNTFDITIFKKED